MQIAPSAVARIQHKLTIHSTNAKILILKFSFKFWKLNWNNIRIPIRNNFPNKKDKESRPRM